MLLEQSIKPLQQVPVTCLRNGEGSRIAKALWLSLPKNSYCVKVIKDSYRVSLRMLVGEIVCLWNINSSEAIYLSYI